MSVAGLPEPVVPFERTFEAFLGLEWVSLSEDEAVVRFEVRDDLKQPMGLMHGGIYSSVAETVSSVATFAQVWEQGMAVMGMSNEATFMRPVTAGHVDAVCRRRAFEDGRWVWSTDFTDDEGRLCASVVVTLAVRPKR